MSEKRRFFLFSLTGIILGISFPPFPFWFLAFFAFIPLLIAFEASNKKLFIFSYIAFFLYHGITNWWISSWQENADPFLIISGIAVALAHPLFFTVPIFIQNYFNKKFGFQKAVWLFPLVWVSFEWAHSLGEISYPWLTIGYNQIYNLYFVQIADLGGVYLVSFIIALINILIYKIYFLYFNQKRNKNKIRNYSLVIISILVVIYIYGISQHYHYNNLASNSSKDDKIKVGIIQPNINPWKKWAKYSSIEMIEIHKRLQDSIKAIHPDIDYFLWSETAITYINSSINSKHLFEPMQYWVNEDKISILSGFSDYYFYQKNERLKSTTKYFLKDTNRPYDTYNSAVLINYDTLFNPSTEIYHKMKLTPFSEYLPYPEVIGFLRKFVEWEVGISSWALGEKQQNLMLNNGKKNANLACIICIESIYPYFVSNFSSMGAEIFNVITNDGWFDYTFGPEQHFTISQMRAIENRRFIARCANTGLSGIINPAGVRTIIAPQYEETAIAGELIKISNQTIYTSIKDLIAYFSFLLIIILFIIAKFKKS